MNPDILDTIKRSSSVPSMPQVVTRFLEIIQEPEFDYEDLTKLLTTDPGTASEILRLSNSPLFGVSRKITSLKQSITLLGPRRIRSLVLGRYMIEAISQQEMGQLDPTYYWRRSLSRGVLSARFAENVVPALREEAFLSGLLAGIGITILAQELPHEYLPVLQQYRPHGSDRLYSLERQVVGVTHGEISAMLMEHWQLPEILCDAVSKYQQRSKEPTQDDTLVRILWSADRIAKLLCESPDTHQLAEKCEEAMHYIQLDLRILSSLLEKIEADIVEMAQLLRIDILASSIYGLIAKAIREYITPQQV